MDPKDLHLLSNFSTHQEPAPGFSTSCFQDRLRRSTSLKSFREINVNEKFNITFGEDKQGGGRVTVQRLPYFPPLLCRFFFRRTSVTIRKEQKLDRHFPCSLAERHLSFGASFPALKISSTRYSCSEGEDCEERASLRHARVSSTQICTTIIMFWHDLQYKVSPDCKYCNTNYPRLCSD